tara:strand:+ start:124 stop:339 length:216 start_codon:yes stop_codon:yes gene_type:complete
MKVKKRKKKNKPQNVDYSTPYKGAMGKSMSRETAKKMWSDKASADEQQLGFKLTQDSDGNFIARTRLSSKA